MRLFTGCWLTCLILSNLGCTPTSSDLLAIVDALLIDGNGGPPVEGAVVVMAGERIRAVGPAESVEVPAGAAIVDARGGAVMPGLSDMHIHLVGGWDGVSTDMLGYQRYLNALLYSGVTTVLDVGNVLPFIAQIRSEVQAGRIPGPRIHLTGPLVDGPEPIWPALTSSARDESDLRAIVRRLREAGVDLIKGYQGLSPRMVDSLVRIAAAESLRVMVDLGPSGDVQGAVQAGVYGLAHAPAELWGRREIAPLVEAGTAVVTTLAVFESFSRRRLANIRFLEYPLIANTTPPWVLRELREFAARPWTAADSGSAEMSTALLLQAMRNVKRMHDEGVMIVAGTDAPYPGVFQGEGIHRELALLVESGLTPLEAITAATKNAATFIGEAANWGTIEPGKAADILVLTGNPAESIGETRNIRAVIQRGRLLDRAALSFDRLVDPGFRTVGSVASN